MSKGNQRRRGSGGHPARVAQRRQRDQERHDSSATPRRIARRVARAAGELQSAADAELWASQLLGTLGAKHGELPDEVGDAAAEAEDVDLALIYGEPLLAELVRMDEPGAAVAMAALADVDDGELGLQAKERLERHNLWRRLPQWVSEIGESEITGAAMLRDPVFGDGATVFLESRFPDGQTMAVGVFIDNNLGGMARDVVVTESLEEVRASLEAEDTEPVDELVLDDLAPGVAAGQIQLAIELTDMSWDPPVLEDYWAGRALALLRADQVPDVVAPEEAPEMAQSERDALRDAFLASEEGSRFSADGLAADIAALAIDFSVDFMDGDPLRWSPTVVEVFMADWIPSEAITTDALLAALPEALAAWVAFAGRQRGIPDAGVARTAEAIGAFREEMLEAAADPDAASPAKQLLLAIDAAGIDADDEVALKAFVSGWIARDDLEPGDGGDAIF